MTGAAKQPLIIATACLINALLFLMIYQMVSKTPQFINVLQGFNIIDFIRLQQPPPSIEEKLRKTRPEQPPPPEETPPVPEVEPEIRQPAHMKPDLPAPDIRLPSSLQGVPYAGEYLKTPADRPGAPAGAVPALPEILTDITPTVRIEPQYPPRALRAGIEGLVTVEFTIAVDGSVKDVNIVSAEPPQIFDQEVLKAVKRWTFQPQTADGQTVEKRARQDIRFTLKK